METEIKNVKDMVICYGLICFNSFEQTKNLIDILDVNNNFVVVHVDAKSTDLFNKLKENYKTNKRVIFLEERITIHWGDVTIAQAEYLLFKKALNLDFDYFKLLSEHCLPVKSDNYIKKFILEHPGKEFIECFKLNSQKWRVSLFHTHNIAKKKRLFPIISSVNWTVNLFFGKRIGNPDFVNEDFYVGTNWILLSRGCLRAIYEYSIANNLLEKYKNSICADEAIVQYAIMRTPYYKNIYDTNRGGALNYSKWKLINSPRTLTIKDTKEINKPDCLYARKFDLEKNREFVESIYKINQK